MLDKIKALFKEGLEYTHTAGVLQQIANLVHMVHEQYMKDGDGKNAAIDSICELLQTHKDAPKIIPVVAAPVETTPCCTQGACDATAQG